MEQPLFGISSISFNDPNLRRRCSALQWNPEVATQLIVASDDDRSPSLQMWDLRNAVSPERELTAHTKGVLSMAWSQHDTNMLLTCAKDNRTLCWDTKKGEPVAELPSSSNWNFDVQWSGRTPGVLGAASFDGKVSLYSLESASAPSNDPAVLNADFTSSPAAVPKAPMLHTPSWMKRPCGVMMGFGGKMVSFKPDGITLGKVVTDQTLVSCSAAFEAAVAGNDKAALKAYCEEKATGAAGSDDAEVWSFMKLLFEDDARRQLMDHLGFQKAEEPEAVETPTPTPPASPSPAAAPPAAEEPAAPPPEEDAAGFFDNLAESPMKPASPPPEKAAEKVEDKVDELAKAVDEIELTPEEAESEASLQAALVVGDYKTAVDVCLNSGRMADALMLASMGGDDLWQHAQKVYMQKAPRPYMKVIKALLSKDLTSLVDERPIAEWRETLALLCTYAPSDEWAELAESLADKLTKNGMTPEGTLCYVCAGSVDKAAAIWSAAYEQSSRSVDTLQAMMEKGIILSKATSAKNTSPALAGLITEYAQLLVSQGEMSTAMNYLTMLPGDDSSSTAALRDRIYGSRPADGSMQKPAAAFNTTDVKTQATPAAPVQQQQQPAAQPAHNMYSQPAQQQPAYQPVGAAAYQPQPTAFTPAPQPSVAYQPHAQVRSYQAQPQAPTASYQAQQPSTMAQYTPQPHTMQPGPAQPAQPAQQPQQAAMFTPQAFQPQAPVQPKAQPVQPVAQVNTSYMPPPAAYQSPSVSVPQRAPPARFTPQAAPQFQPGQQVPGQYGQAQQPAAPAAPPKPAAPAGPPANISVETADTSQLKDELRPIVTSLTNLYSACAAASQMGAKKRESDDNSKRMGGLFWKLSNGDVSATVSSKLLQMAAALDVGDFSTATSVQVALTTSDWDECSQWLTALKRLIKTRQTLQ